MADTVHKPKTVCPQHPTEWLPCRICAEEQKQSMNTQERD